MTERELLGHRNEGLRQLSDLIAFGHGDAIAEIALHDVPGSREQLADVSYQPTRKQIGRHDG